jgi:hypothetical protein
MSVGKIIQRGWLGANARFSEVASRSILCYPIDLLGHVAQWIEHQIPVLRVGGSNPSMLIAK